MIQDAEKVAELKIEEISRILREFIEKFSDGTDDPNRFLSLNEMERLWSELRNGSDKIYSDLFNYCLSHIDEDDLIRKKKPNMGPKGSG